MRCTERSSTRTNGWCRAASQRHDDRQWLKTQRMCGGTSQGGDRCYAGNVVRVALTHLQIMCETHPRSVKIRAYAWLASLVRSSKPRSFASQFACGLLDGRSISHCRCMSRWKQCVRNADSRSNAGNVHHMVVDVSISQVLLRVTDGIGRG